MHAETLRHVRDVGGALEELWVKSGFCGSTYGWRSKGRYHIKEKKGESGTKAAA